MAEVRDAATGELTFVEVVDPIDAVLQGLTLDGHRKGKHKRGKKRPKHHAARRPAHHATGHHARPRHVSPGAVAAGLAAGGAAAAAGADLSSGVPSEDGFSAPGAALDVPGEDDGAPDTSDTEEPEEGEDEEGDEGDDLEAPDPNLQDADVIAALGDADVDLNGFFDFIAAPFKALVKVATAPIHLLEKIPFIGGPIHAVVGASPIGLVEHVAAGERLDHALLNHFKDQVHAVHDLAPYATMVVSFVPGIGTGVAAAIAAGAALAEGRSISDAAIAGVRGAIPGGALAQTGFDAAVKIAKGQNVGKVALDAARTQLPGPAQKAFDIGVAVMTGKSIQNAVLAAMGSLSPDAVKQILADGARVVRQARGLVDIAKKLPDVGARNGFALAAGLLAHHGTTAEVLNKARSKLQGSAKVGFEALLHAQAAHFPAAEKALHGPDPQEAVANAAAAIRFADFVKKTAAGVALLFPASMSATTALIAADRAMRVANGERGTPIERKQMSDAIVVTHKLAAQKNADAVRTLSFMALAKTTRGVAGGKPVSHAKTPLRVVPKPHEVHGPAKRVKLVHPTGVIEEGNWKQVPKGTAHAVFAPVVDGTHRVRGYFVRVS